MGVWMVLVLVKYLRGATFLQQMASKYHTLRPTRGEGEGGQFGIHPGSYCCHLICFVWVCPLLAIAGHLSYHVPMFDMTINSQQF